jgi:hypothetical protein
MQKVTGIGGLFIKAKDAEAQAEWYQKHLGIEFGSLSITNCKQLFAVHNFVEALSF